MPAIRCCAVSSQANTEGRQSSLAGRRMRCRASGEEMLTRCTFLPRVSESPACHKVVTRESGPLDKDVEPGRGGTYLRVRRLTRSQLSR
jgi:hypothetical protein